MLYLYNLVWVLANMEVYCCFSVLWDITNIIVYVLKLNLFKF